LPSYNEYGRKENFAMRRTGVADKGRGKGVGMDTRKASSALRVTTRVAEGGRIVIPAAVRKRLGLKVGTRLVLTVDGDSATLVTVETALRRVQEWVCQLVGPGVSLSEELMAERKEEFKRE